MGNDSKDQLITTLGELGVTEESYRVLTLLPLVLTAWADGKVQDAETRKLLEVAQRNDYLPESGVKILEGWLAERPSADYVNKSLRALVELARRTRGVGADINHHDLHKLAELSHDVAAAAGGLWGLTSPKSAAEEELLASLAETLQIDSGISWKEMLDDLE